jgi:hypothetical protein
MTWYSFLDLERKLRANGCSSDYTSSERSKPIGHKSYPDVLTKPTTLTKPMDVRADCACLRPIRRCL